MKNIVKAIMSAALSGCMLMPFAALAAEPVSFTDEEIKLADSNRYRAVSYIGNSSLFMGDFDGNGELTASDARMLLRYTAGLEQKPGDDEFDYRCDMNADNRITPADARLVLRIVSKIDNSDITYLNAFNTILNAVKPDNQKVRTSYRNTVMSKNYDNKNVSVDFKNELNDMIKSLGILGFAIPEDVKDELNKLSLDKELTTIDHRKDDDYITPNIYPKDLMKCNIKFPLDVQSKISSMIDMSQVNKIIYNPNDVGTFVIKSRYVSKETGDYTVNYSAEVNSASITVYLKDESLMEIPDNKMTIDHGKLFNLANLDNNIDFNDVGDDFKEFGEITCKLDSVKYHDSYVKVYFNNNTASTNYGKPIYIDYNLNYDINFYSHILLDFDLKKQIANIPSNTDAKTRMYVNDYFTFTTAFAERTQFYFEQNAN
ncbi:MAG: dockerin type I domain-containing protein [Oscillospiraceae bacterium]|nr:dockerin type I domain-containing protein [Oscillospiraceae bacterium]